MGIQKETHLFSVQLNPLGKRHCEIAAVSAPTEAMQLATKESGGELEGDGITKAATKP